MKKKFSFILALSTLLSMGANAQTRILPSLEANPDVRTAGMGNALLGNTKQMHIYSNPATMVYADRKMSIDLSTEIHPKAEDGRLMQYNVAGGYKLGKSNALMAGLRYQGGLIVMGNAANSDSRIRPYELTLDLGYSFAITREIAVYATGTYAKSHSATSTDAFAFSVGAAYQKAIDLSSTATLLTVGARLMDFGKSVKFNDTGLPYSLPTSVVAGGDWVVQLSDQHALTYALSCRYFTPKDGHETLVGAGIEYTYNTMVSARVGYQFADKASNALTVGLGGEYAGFKLDASYAHTFDLYGIDLFQVGIGYTF